MAKEFQNDLFSMPGGTAPTSYLWTVLLSPCFVLAAHWFAQRRISKMEWLQVLGATE